jgi:soluble lytic murein transglycosylase-like protein
LNATKRASSNATGKRARCPFCWRSTRAARLSPRAQAGRRRAANPRWARPSRLFWEAAYPRAFADAAQGYGKAFGSPELFVYAIMRKESSYFPFAVSSSDARGLLQLIPSTGAEVAKKLALAFYPTSSLIPTPTSTSARPTWAGFSIASRAKRRWPLAPTTLARTP